MTSTESTPLTKTTKYSEDVESFNKKQSMPSVACGVSVVVLSLASVGLIAYSSNSYQSSQQMQLMSTRIKMATSGTIMYSSLSDTEKSLCFEDFITLYSRSYKDDDEKEERYENFKAFLEVVDERNTAEAAASGTATHGVTIFSDLSEDEFKMGYLGYKSASTTRKLSKNKFAKKATVPKRKSDTSTSVNWAGIYTTPVKDQGYCGSCWAFSVTEQIESDSIRAGLLTTSDTLSTQQIVSCDTANWGCQGGETETAYAYVEQAGGLLSASDYPYSSYLGVTGTCDISALTESKSAVLTSYYSIKGETDMETYVLTEGPLSVCLAASTWNSYTSGIVSVCDKNVDHCVQAGV